MRITRNVREYTAGERQFLLYKFLLTHASKNGVIDNAAKMYKNDGASLKDAPSRYKMIKDVRGTLQDIVISDGLRTQIFQAAMLVKSVFRLCECCASDLRGI